MMKAPFVSVIIVNYNGRDFLKPCLDSLLRLNYPPQRFEVILVDNQSADNSVNFIKNNYPWVKLIVSAKNLGFAAGNNLGVKEAQGEYLAFLNNDTEVHERWLSSLVKRALSSPRIAAVNGRSLLWCPCVEAKVIASTHLRSEFQRSIDFEEVGVAIEDVQIAQQDFLPLVEYREGILEKQKNEAFQWSTGNASTLIPVHPQEKNFTFTLTLRSEKPFSGIDTKIEIQLAGKTLQTDSLSGHQVKQYSFSLPVKGLQKSFIWKVQNAGNVIFKDGYARDRGSVVKGTQNHYEPDQDFFAQPTSLNGFCGNNLMIRTNIFRSLGGFDERFFMYYEDCELSARITRAGYKILYEPDALIYHKHSATSGEWSPFFFYQTNKNRLLFLLLHFPLWLSVRESCKTVFLFFKYSGKALRWKFTNHWEIYDELKEKAGIQKEILLSIPSTLGAVLKDRYKLHKKLRLPIKIYEKTLA